MLLLVLLAGCNQPPGQPPLPTLSPQPTPSDEAIWEVSVYFTDPTHPNAGAFRGGPDAYLAEAINQAQTSVDAAIFDLNLWSIRDALVAAHKRGVAVRVVTESDNLDEAEIQDVKEAGIPVLGDRREGLMHNKFVVIDSLDVWTGSMNFTTTDGYLNDNNLVHLRSSKLAQNYTVEFKEMFEEDLFGPDVRSATPFPRFQVNQVLVENYFSPDDGTASRLEELASSAEHSLYFLAFSFTSDTLAQALLERAAAGVIVAGVFEESQVISNIGSEYQRLLDAGIDVRLDSNPRNMHHKVLLIDDRIVVFGSYNFSSSAENRNDENTIILTDPHIAAQFLQEFQRIFKLAHR